MAETFQNTSVKLSSTAVTDLYVAPNNTSADRAVVLSALAANVDGSAAAEVSLFVTNSANTVVSTLASTITLPQDASLEFIPNKLVLENGQKLRAQASAANDIDFTVSVLEIA